MVCVTSWIAHRISVRIRRVQRPGGPDRRRRLPRASTRAASGTRSQDLSPVDQSHVRPAAARCSGRSGETERSATAGPARGRAGPSTAELADGGPDERPAPRQAVSRPRPATRRLSVALRQLAMTEEQVKGLLSLGRVERRPPERLRPAAAPRGCRLPGRPGVPARQGGPLGIGEGTDRSRSSPTRRACGPRS